MLIHDIINHCHYFYYKYWWGHVASNNDAASHCPDSYSGRMSSIPSCQEYQLPWLMAESCGSDAQGYTLFRCSWLQWPVHVNTQGSSFPVSDGTIFQIFLAQGFLYTGRGFSCSCSTSGVAAWFFTVSTWLPHPFQMLFFRRPSKDLGQISEPRSPQGRKPNAYLAPHFGIHLSRETNP